VACAFVFFTNPHSFFLTLSISLSLFSEHKHFPLARSGVAQKVKSCARSCAHASADAFFLLFFLAVGFCGGASDFVPPRHLVLLLQAASLFVHFCIA
jgi:hypothetical protein